MLEKLYKICYKDGWITIFSSLFCWSCFLLRCNHEMVSLKTAIVHEQLAQIINKYLRCIGANHFSLFITFLENKLIKLLDNVPLIISKNIWLQNDQLFPNKWIDRRGITLLKWPKKDNLQFVGLFWGISRKFNPASPVVQHDMQIQENGVHFAAL